VKYRIVFAPEAEEQLAALYHYIASASSTNIADRFAEAIVRFCESLSTFPERGNKRDEVRPGLRVTHYRKRVVIAFVVDADLVSILGVFYGGQDYETILQDEPET
jgi:plasmid stabilization system protein ParE